MKKNYYKANLPNTNQVLNNNENYLEAKTTNVNILLNRVRLENKKTLNKRILFSLSLVASISIFAVFSIIQF